MGVTRQGDFRFDAKHRDAIRFFRTGNRIIANVALEHFLSGFRIGGGKTDASRGGWKERAKSDKNRRQRRAILVKTGRLRRSIQILQSNAQGIIIGTKGVRYAETHNVGDEKRGIPKREFLGDSKVLNKKIVSILVKRFNFIVK